MRYLAGHSFFAGLSFAAICFQKIGALLRTDAASPEDARGSIGILFRGFCELRVIGLVGGGIKFFWHDRGRSLVGWKWARTFSDGRPVRCWMVAAKGHCR